MEHQADIDVTGDWIGYYTFDEHYLTQVSPQPISFTMRTKPGIREFIGHIFEQSTFGRETAIDVIGHQRGCEIEFLKLYTLRQYRNARNEVVTIGRKSPRLVYYRGTYDSQGDVFHGQWEISGVGLRSGGAICGDDRRGRWVMWRQKSQHSAQIP